MTSTWLTMLLVPIALRLVTKGRLKLEYVLATIARMVVLFFLRMAVQAFYIVRHRVTRFVNRKSIQPVRMIKVTSVLDIERRYNLKPFEVLIGFDGVRPIRVHLNKHHTLVAGLTGFGKALALDTPIPTPTGWTTMGQVQVGDIVFDDQGNQCQVIGTSQIMYHHNVYKVEFDDGSFIKADEDHLWMTMTHRDRRVAASRTIEWREKRRRKRPSIGNGIRTKRITHELLPENKLSPAPTGSIKTTKEILGTLHSNHFINVAESLQIQEIDLPIHPYILGCWLGDGSSYEGGLICNDQEIVDRIESLGYIVNKRSHQYGYGILNIKSHLRDLNLIQNKHIPNMYLRASVDQRLELLRGLMDTDGFCSKDGYCHFYTTKKELADDFIELIRTLNIKCKLNVGKATLYGKNCGEKYQFCFTTNIQVFSLPRKLTRQKSIVRLTSKRHYIKNITPIETEPVKCIMVDSPSHLYLAGESMIPTHNTMLIQFILAQLFNKGEKFMSQADVYLIDLKGAEDDKFENWRPMLKGYYSITADRGGVEQAILALTDIIEQMHKGNKTGDKKRIFVFIDELAMLTIMSPDPNLRREAEAALERLAGQLRVRGNLICATQYPKGTVIPTTVRFNLARRISFHVESLTELEVILGFRPKERDRIIPQNEGEFLLREPGKVGLKTGKSMLIDIPGDIDQIVYKYMDMKASDDDRLKLFIEACGGKKIGDRVTGINVVSKAFKGTFNTQAIKLAYRHFALAGAWEPPKTQGQSYLMASDYTSAFDKVVKYIGAGNWSKDPTSLIGEEVENE